MTGIFQLRGGRSAGMAMAMAALALLPGQSALHAQGTSARFDPVAFFTGPTASEGTLSQILSSTKPTRVTTFGVRQANGDMVLEQDVKIGDQPVRHRVWRLRETSPGRYAGTISDAATDVTGRLEGNQLTLTYTMDNNLGVHQVITARPGGQVADNVMRIRRFGITVARLRETIRKVKK